MRITEVGRTETAKGVRSVSPAPSSNDPAKPVSPVDCADRVQISDTGRALAARIEEARSRTTYADLTPERINDVRQRVLAVAYDSSAMVDRVARRILESGDL
ncbi:hypothetical protein BH23PLA1_BH23PLA1_39280 [soil metagenome]